MAADTGANILQPFIDHFGDPLRICQELPGNAHGIDLALSYCLGTYLRLHTAGADHGNIHKLLNVGNILQIAVLGHIHGRMRPVPGVVCTVVGIEHIIARVLQILGGLLRFCHAPTLFLVGLSR